MQSALCPVGSGPASGSRPAVGGTCARLAAALGVYRLIADDADAAPVVVCAADDR
jgi:hypothetical protein